MLQSDRLIALQKLLEKEPNDSFLNYAHALELQKLGNHLKAIEIIETIVKSDENYLGAYYQLGQLYELIGEKEKARNAYLQGCTIAQDQKQLKALSELKQAVLMMDE
ncbi:MAG: tetratricopeptide repeat protein [Bacteroidetes bacterium]|nr:tetratricopeptide repeat protein [Bacteroidota bacterium]MBK9673565.1 tetratricopeptide repeat protein [Bacteroidota bacterium]MBK9799135.1 tetratricopeptide repeat protein [Bacteroidota bacterium]MBP6412375.1 tetratricopeptide repeat protein [Bacteroidia bacterium]